MHMELQDVGAETLESGYLEDQQENGIIFKCIMGGELWVCEVSCADSGLCPVMGFDNNSSGSFTRELAGQIVDW